MSSKMGNIILLFAILALSSCANLSFTSTAVFANSSGDHGILENVREKVEEKVRREGGSCRLNHLGDGLLRCVSADQMSITTGFDRNRDVFIYIDANRTVIFPPSQSDLDDGSYVPAKLIEWENWIVSEFDGFEFSKRIRNTAGGVSRSF